MKPDNSKKKPLASLGSEVDETLYIPAVTVSVGGDPTLPGRNNLIGKEISINLRATSMFGIGPIFLTPKNYWCVIPDGLTNEEYNMIQVHLNDGLLVMGKKFIEPVARASDVPEEYWIAIDKSGLDNKVTKDKFAKLLRMGVDRNYTAKEIAEYCLQRESKRKNRKGVINALTQIINNHSSPLTMWEPPDEAEGIKKVIVKPDGSTVAVLNNGKTVEKGPEVKKPSDHVGGKKKPTQALNDIL